MSSQTMEESRPDADGAPALEHTIEELRCYEISFTAAGQVIGRAQLHGSSDHWLEVVDLHVEPGHRGEGHSATILEALTKIAQGLGASKLSAHTSPDNRPAYSAFVRMGFKRHHDETHMEREI